MAANLPTANSAPLHALREFLDHLPEPRIVMDSRYRIVAANRAYMEAYGTGGEILGRTCFDVSHRFEVPCDLAGESCPLAKARRSRAPQRALHLHHTPRGEEHVLVETAPVADCESGETFYVETLSVVRHASTRPAAQGLVGRAPAFRRMLDRLLRAAPAMANVLLLGETGTGKEVAARALHEASGRAAGPFVPVDCSGLSETLFESELFGHEKGAFTGASHRKTGLVEAAAGGTLFLDEVGDIPAPMQVKLLRLLETGTYRRVGGVDVLPADFRLVSATHRDLAGMVRRGEFRRDLYYRINTFPVHVPSLAERRSDIALLAQSLLARVDHRPGRTFSPEALTALSERDFEGNIRELRNLIERATLLADGDRIELGDLEDDPGGALPAPPAPAGGVAFTVAVPMDLAGLERAYLLWASAVVPGDRNALAATLGISERTLYRKLKSVLPD
ncbi:MAG TPA: sigma 54-interacting transcriptional regulator [Rhodocyclaceae bacterium]|nr:sigma 54-interacting transcriptional regulator [Rhodocyclaceae bacterium]